MAEPALPSRVDRYEILGQLGRGSMGLVLLARDPNIDRRLALKVMAPVQLLVDETEREEIRKRFVQEARAAGRLSHPGIVMVLDADTDAVTGWPYIAMELVEGESLEAVLRRRGRLAPGRAAALAAEVAAALAYAHDRGVIHRDVKPANILLASDGRAKVSDFGIAKLATQSLTVAGQVLGSPFFMSPEQVRGEPLDGRSDLFSLGAVLYQAVSGGVPFGGDTIATVTFKVVNIDHRPADEHVALPASLVALIDRCLAKAPEDRFPDGHQLAAALTAIVDELGGGDDVAGLAMTSPSRAIPDPSPAVARPASGRSASEQLTRPSAAGAPALRGSPLRPARGRRRRASVVVAAAAVLVTVVAAGALLVWRLASPVGEGWPRPGAPEVAAPGSAARVEEESAAIAAAPLEPRPSPARLHLSFERRLVSGTLALWVDGERVWLRDLGEVRNPLRMVASRELQHTLPVPPGERTIEVRVTGRAAGRRVDTATIIAGRFTADEARSLRVSLDPLTRDLDLAWVD